MDRGSRVEANKDFRVGERYIELTPEEVAVTQTRTFQRLNFIKQLGLVYLVYPNATHTRGSHSLNALYQAQKILDALLKSGEDPAFIAANRPAIRMAALLHDIGHIPFSHVLEDEHQVIEKHDGPARMQPILALLKGEIADTVEDRHGRQTLSLIDAAAPILHGIHAGEAERNWKSDIIGNTICADLLAYIEEDARWSGIERQSGHYSIYKYFVLAGDKKDQLCIRLTKGGLRTDVVSAIMAILEARYDLTERVLFHHAKCVASSMLARAVRLASATDVAHILEQHMGDEAFLDYVQRCAIALPCEGALRLLENLQCRRLYKRIFKLNAAARREEWDNSHPQQPFTDMWRDGPRVEGLLAGIEQRYGLPAGVLVLWCPPAKAGMKAARVHVIWNAGAGPQLPMVLRDDRIKERFPSVWRRVDSQEQQYQDLWTFWVAIDEGFMDKAPEVVSALEEGLGVRNDSLFRDTHLYERYPEYKLAEERLKETTDGARHILDEVNERRRTSAARGGHQPTIAQIIQEVVGGEARQLTMGETPE